MTTIETHTIDAYVRSMMADTSMPAAERARHAAAATQVHVLTEAHQPLDATLEVEQSEIDHALAEVEYRFAEHRDDIADAVDGVRMEFDLDVPEGLREVLLGVIDTSEDEEATVVSMVEAPTEDLTALTDEELAERAEQERMDAFMRGDLLR